MGLEHVWTLTCDRCNVPFNGTDTLSASLQREALRAGWRTRPWTWQPRPANRKAGWCCPSCTRALDAAAPPAP